MSEKTNPTAKMCPYYKEPCLKDACWAYSWENKWVSAPRALDPLHEADGLTVSHEYNACLALNKRPLGETRNHHPLITEKEAEG